MNIAICGDSMSLDYRTMLRKLARIHKVGVRMVICNNGRELLFHLEEMKRQLDIIYLDMDMPELQGEETARLLRKQGCLSELIFCASSAKHYSCAFDVNAFHYIVKGEMSEKKFEDIFLRAVQAVREKTKNYIVCTGSGELRHIAINSIRYLYIAKRVVTVHYGTAETFSFYATFRELEDKLKGQGFVRVHRSYIIGIPWVCSLSNREIALDTGERLPVSRKYYESLKNAMCSCVV